jgi:hypothetical protein
MTSVYYDKVLKLTEVALRTGIDQFDPDGFTTVRVSTPQSPDGRELVELQCFLAGTTAVEARSPTAPAPPFASIEDQVSAGLEAPLRSKLSGQLKRAKNAGYHVMLLIDQVEDPASRQTSQFLASPATVGVVVTRVLSSFPNVVDSVWFRNRDGAFTNLVPVQEQ